MKVICCYLQLSLLFSRVMKIMENIADTKHRLRKNIPSAVAVDIILTFIDIVRLAGCPQNPLTHSLKVI